MNDGAHFSESGVAFDPAYHFAGLDGISSVGQFESTVSHVGRGKNLFQRDPTVGRRVGRNNDLLVSIMNALLLRGAIYEDFETDLSRTWKLAADSFNDPDGDFPTGTFTESFP